MLINTAVMLHTGYIKAFYFYADYAVCMKVAGADSQPAFARR